MNTNPNQQVVTMDHSMWRSRSRIVAYLDVILSTLWLIVTILIVLLGATATTLILNQKHNDVHFKEELESGLNVVLWIVWVGIAIITIIACIDLWAAVMLLKATRPGADPIYALGRARIWRNVSIVFLIFSVIFSAGTESYYSLAIGILFRGILLYIVCKFIGELEQMSVSSFPAPDNVAVKH